MKKILFTLFLVFAVAAGSSFAQSFKVIVNSSNPVSSLSKKEASDYFLKKKAKWPNGNPVIPVDLSSGSSVREAFSQHVHGKSTSAVRNFWQQAAFSGAGTAPSEKASDNDVIEFIKKTPGAIGYVSAGANTSNVKVLTLN
jgi:ABC-type phosphate transport system substrate-binding protein